MKKQFLFLFLAASIWSCNQTKQDASKPVASTPQPIEFADSTYSQTCKQGLSALSSGDIEGFSSSFADNIIYRFNNGDSIVGKQAVKDYWKDRRGNVIDKIGFSNDIWLSLKVNQSQKVKPGNWVLGWFLTSATYKTGKSMSQNIHNLYHFDNNGKIDLVIQYLDRVPIMVATKK